MKLIENQVYLTLKECVECGLNERTITDAKDKGSKCWKIIKNPDNMQMILISYEDLKPVYRKMVDERFGSVYDVVARQPILDLVVNDHKAVEFFKGYRYDGGVKYLPIETVNKYARAASWLRMLGNPKLNAVVKGDLKIKLITEFYIHVGHLIGLEKERGKKDGYTGVDVLPGDFPGTYQRLMARVTSFMETLAANGAEAAYVLIIDARFENKSAAKLGKVTATSAPVSGVVLPPPAAMLGPVMPVNGGEMVPEMANKGGAFALDLYERQTALIRHCAGLGNNLNAEQVRKMVNIVFAQNGWETVSVGTIRRFMKENKHVLTPGRQGKRKYMASVAMQNKRRAPKYPMVYVTLDGWTVELMYKEYKKGKGWEYKRMVVVVVLDPFNKYPLGYAVGDRETADLIRQACRNAVIHAQELFGKAYHPLQVQSDRYQIKNLTPFYTAVAGRHYTPAQVGNSKAKVIEPYFNYLNDLCQAQYINWSGHNVDANKDNQVNREWLDMIKGQFPDKAGVVWQIDELMAQERKLKGAAYVAKWAELPAEDKMELNAVDYLMVFGEDLGATNKITGQGIIKQIGCVAYTYDSFDRVFRDNMHIDWQLKGDVDNLTTVLATSPDGKIRVLLEQKRELPMDLYSTTQEDVDYRMKVANYNKERMAEITKMYGDDAEVVRELLGSEATGIGMAEEDEKALQLMFTKNGQQKEGLQDAKGLGEARRRLALAEAKDEAADAQKWAQEQYDYHAGGIDLGAYGG